MECALSVWGFTKQDYRSRGQVSRNGISCGRQAFSFQNIFHLQSHLDGRRSVCDSRTWPGTRAYVNLGKA